MDNNNKTEKISKGPRTRMCYICGRQYGLSSYEIHLKQCKDLWVARESQKPPSERKPLPPEPQILGYDRPDTTNSGSAAQQPSHSVAGAASVVSGRQSVKAPKNLDALNMAASETFNKVSLAQCAYCGRSFLEEKLAIHNRYWPLITTVPIIR